MTSTPQAKPSSLVTGCVGLSFLAVVWLLVSCVMFGASYWVAGLPFLASGDGEGIYALFKLVEACFAGALGVGASAAVVAIPFFAKLVPKPQFSEGEKAPLVIGVLVIVVAALWSAGTIAIAASLGNDNLISAFLPLVPAGLGAAMSLVTVTLMVVLALRVARRRP